MGLIGQYRGIALSVLFTSMVTVAGPCAATEFPVTYQSIAKAELQPKYHATHAPFQPGNVISGREAGLVGDGRTDNTEAFRRLFSKPGLNVQIEPGDYLTGRFVILGDTFVTLSPGVTIRDSGHLAFNEQLLQIYGDHVKIVGTGAKVVENRADYTTGQARHGIVINHRSDVTIEGLESSNSGGDGFYITGPVGKPATNISLINCIARNNRRQGLSITNARNVDIINSTFSSSQGTKPEFGVDLEPNRKTDYLDNILLYGVRTEANHGGGIAIYLAQVDATSPKVDIDIVGHTSAGEATPFITYTLPRSVGGAIRYAKVQ